jgi:hypothetical protein
VSQFVERCSGRKRGAVMGGIHVTPTVFSGTPRGFVRQNPLTANPQWVLID